MRRIHPVPLLSLLACMSFNATPARADEDFDAEQARLDAACEAAREAKLAPERARYIEECIEQEQRPDRESCERFYADYGNQSGDRAPLYLDLPECVKAFEHQQSGE